MSPLRKESVNMENPQASLQDSVNGRQVTFNWFAPVYSFFTGMLFLLRGVPEIWFRKKIYQKFIPRNIQGNLIDICSANGFGTAIIASLFPHLTVKGIDRSNEMIQIAQKRTEKLPNLSFKKGDCTKIPYPDNHFNICTAFLALHEIPTEKLPLVLNEIKRILTPKGYLLVVDFSFKQPFTIVRKILFNFVQLFEDNAAQRFMLTDMSIVLKKWAFKQIKHGDFLGHVLSGTLYRLT
ncbi:MAG: class I SAM-dependent methyltransferase [Asgard group archaeon]|nr:class I SAM-dependent methyltransferase [Asgard group archaeon]